MHDEAALLRDDDRPWMDLSEREQEEDPYADHHLGPFVHHTAISAPSQYYYNLEEAQFVWILGEDQHVLTLEEVRNKVREADMKVHEVIDHSGANADEAISSGEEESEGSEDVSTMAQRASRMKGRTMRKNMTALSPWAVESGPYRPQRLPWKLLYCTTRSVQLAWLLMFVMYTIDLAYPTLNFDQQISVEELEESIEEDSKNESAKAVEARRLHGNSTWRFETIEAAWPQRELFRPETVSCLPDGSLLLGTPYELYQAKPKDVDARPSSFALESVPRPSFPPGSVALCSSTASAVAGGHLCILGAAAVGGIAFWPFGSDRWGSEAVVMPIEGGRPWRQLSGAALPCAAVAELLVLSDGDWGRKGDWCLLLAGWDGERLPVAVLRLPRGPSAPPAAGTIQPIFDAPLRLLRGMPGGPSSEMLPAKVGERDVVALHVEGRRGRMWVLLAAGELQGWDLLASTTLGRWHPSWPLSSGGFQATALCEDASGRGLLVLGRSPEDGPQLFYAEHPSCLFGF